MAQTNAKLISNNVSDSAKQLNEEILHAN